jgi:O-antigen ligase
LTGITGDFVKDNRYRQLHMSSYMMITNMYVALNSFKEHPITGYGFGSHEKAYDKFLPDVMLRYSTLGRGDAGSLAFRLITEMGLIGLIVFLYFTAKYRIKSRSSFDDHQQVLWLINASVFVLIVLYLARNGNYTINGKMFFLLMYYYTAQALQGKWLPPYLRGEEAKEGTPVPTLA